MRDDVVLHRGVTEVGVAQRAAAFHLKHFEPSVGTFAHHVGQHQHVVEEEAGLEQHRLACGVEQLRGAFGVGVDVALQLGADVDGVGEGGLEGVFELASAVEAAHLLGAVAGDAGVVDVEPQRTVALQPTDVFALAQQM